MDAARRVALARLVWLPVRSRERAAASVAEALWRAGFFSGQVEQHYSAARVAELVGRCPEHVVSQVKAGQFGPVFRDAGGWIIPASGVQRWLASRLVSVPEVLA